MKCTEMATIMKEFIWQSPLHKRVTFPVESTSPCFQYLNQKQSQTNLSCWDLHEKTPADGGKVRMDESLVGLKGNRWSWLETLTRWWPMERNRIESHCRYAWAIWEIGVGWTSWYTHIDMIKLSIFSSNNSDLALSPFRLAQWLPAPDDVKVKQWCVDVLQLNHWPLSPHSWIWHLFLVNWLTGGIPALPKQVDS